SLTSSVFQRLGATQAPSRQSVFHRLQQDDSCNIITPGVKKLTQALTKSQKRRAARKRIQQRQYQPVFRKTFIPDVNRPVIIHRPKVPIRNFFGPLQYLKKNTAARSSRDFKENAGGNLLPHHVHKIPSNPINKAVYEAYVAARIKQRAIRRKRAPPKESNKSQQTQNLFQALTKSKRPEHEMGLLQALLRQKRERAAAARERRRARAARKQKIPTASVYVVTRTQAGSTSSAENEAVGETNQTPAIPPIPLVTPAPTHEAGATTNLAAFEERLRQKEDIITQLQGQVREMARMMHSFTQGLGAGGTTPEPVLQQDIGTPPTVPIAVVPTLVPAQHQHPSSSDNTEGLTSARIEEIVAEKMKQVSAEDENKKVGIGRPYPAHFDQVPYPKGYLVPRFKIYDGIGNPIQHIAHFQASCGNTGSDEALLLRQFVQSLDGVAFAWYQKLEPDSIRSWGQMVHKFTQRFSGLNDDVTIADLAATRRNTGESVVEYITRWRNLSIRCDRPLEQPEAIKLLLKNIDDWTAPFLCSSGAKNFQDLISHAAQLEKMNPKGLYPTDKPKAGGSNARKGDNKKGV
ncbi:retrotransposon gag domain-containing protein, partial [Serratia marcescens]|nr:retrotransposon gag domain-containing protein [Serratia marcescens]